MPQQLLPPWTAATAVLVMAALTSCGDGSRSEGALGGDDPGAVRQCTPIAGSSPVVFAGETLENESTRPLTLDEVRLVEPDGLTLVDASLLPIENRTLVGTVALPPSSPAWPERREAVGAELAPGETWNLALTLDRDQEPASFSDIEVAYTVGGDSSTHRLRYALTVVAAPTCPTTDG